MLLFPKKTINHENIHTAQMIEMLFVFFYLWYGVEWALKAFKYGLNGAYRNVSFECEAYSNEINFEYLKKRRLFAWLKYL
jgi:hypothetical protein